MTETPRPSRLCSRFFFFALAFSLCSRFLALAFSLSSPAFVTTTHSYAMFREYKTDMPCPTFQLHTSHQFLVSSQQTYFPPSLIPTSSTQATRCLSLPEIMNSKHKHYPLIPYLFINAPEVLPFITIDPTVFALGQIKILVWTLGRPSPVTLPLAPIIGQTRRTMTSISPGRARNKLKVRSSNSSFQLHDSDTRYVRLKRNE